MLHRSATLAICRHRGITCGKRLMQARGTRCLIANHSLVFLPDQMRRNAYTMSVDSPEGSFVTRAQSAHWRPRWQSRTHDALRATADLPAVTAYRHTFHNGKRLTQVGTEHVQHFGVQQIAMLHIRGEIHVVRLPQYGLYRYIRVSQCAGMYQRDLSWGGMAGVGM